MYGIPKRTVDQRSLGDRYTPFNDTGRWSNSDPVRYNTQKSDVRPPILQFIEKPSSEPPVIFSQHITPRDFGGMSSRSHEGDVYDGSPDRSTHHYRHADVKPLSREPDAVRTDDEERRRFRELDTLQTFNDNSLDRTSPERDNGRESGIDLVTWRTSEDDLPALNNGDRNLFNQGNTENMDTGENFNSKFYTNI